MSNLPIADAADRAIRDTGPQHPGRLAAAHHALTDAGAAIAFAFSTLETLAGSRRIGDLVEAALEAENAGVADDVFTVVADVLRAAAARSAPHLPVMP